MNRAAIDWARTTVLESSPADLDPETCLFLLRDYVRGGDASVRNSVEAGLTLGLDGAAHDPDPCRRVHWVRLLAEGAVLSDDGRPSTVVTRELAGVIDGLEARVRRSYEPGEGLLGEACDVQFACASALLAAFDLTGRLPYAMLADELLQHARRTWWNDAAGAYDADFGSNCTALRVTCRLAGLHADSAYQQAAVLPPRREYTSDATRLAATLERRAGEYPRAAGLFGAALLEWFALKPNLQ